MKITQYDLREATEQRMKFSLIKKKLWKPKRERRRKGIGVRQGLLPRLVQIIITEDIPAKTKMNL
jgi:hypothetical protein